MNYILHGKKYKKNPHFNRSAYSVVIRGFSSWHGFNRVFILFFDGPIVIFFSFKPI